MKAAGASHHNVADARFASPLTPGHSDGLGERWTTVDASDSAPLELLRFRSDVARAPGFEDALRERVELLVRFTDPVFATVRDVIREGDYLTLVARRAQGQRLSQLSPGKLAKAQRPAFVTRMLRDTTSALATLEAAAPGVTHGALTADRIVLTPEGHVCLTEYVLAPALQQLALWPEELWTEYGLLARADDDGQAVFDARTTVMQLAVASLSVLLARHITLQDFEHRLPALLEEFGALASKTPSLLVTPLRAWLGRALQLGADSYQSAVEAHAGLKELLAAQGPAAVVEVDTFQFQARPGTRTQDREDSRDATRETGGERDGGTARLDGASDRESVQRAHSAGPEATAAVAAVAPLADTLSGSRSGQYVTWAAVVLGVAALGEAAFISWLMTRPPVVTNLEPAVVIESPQAGDTVMVDGRAVGSTPLQLRVNSQMHAIRLVPVAPVPAPITIDSAAATAKAETDRAAAAIDQAAARQRSGGVAFSSPIELKVFEGERVLGSTADGPIVASAGTHQLDLVNTALGFRVRQAVTIRAGVITPLTVTPPMGRISINAQPWAQVLIDGTAIGDTPLANIAVALGDHQITFRHPQLGERLERVTVRADAPARVSTTFQR